jgi:hypothetical protein
MAGSGTRLSRWTPLVGVVGTLLLHALILLPLMIDLALPRKVPNRSGVGASVAVSDEEAAMTVVFIDEPSSAEHQALRPKVLASRGHAPADLPLVVVSPDPRPAPEPASAKEEDSARPEAAQEQTQHAILLGRYLGQLQARVERAWNRPRSDIGAPMFSCRVRIQQDHHGSVTDVRFDRCTRNERWQQSLVSAIRTASPLPAPPDPSVYADRIWLTFASEGFRQAGPTQGFEPERRTSLTAAKGSQTTESLDRLPDQLRRNHLQLDRKEDAKVIHLTIIGNPTSTARSPSTEPIKGPSTPATSDTPLSAPQ